MAVLFVSTAGISWGAPKTLIIALYNYADIPQEVLDPALRVVGQVLNGVGIRPEWSFCPTGNDARETCTLHLMPEGRYVVMNIMRAQSDAMRACATCGVAVRTNTTGDIAGSAIFDSARLRGARAFAFWDKIQTLASQSRRRASLLLACVVVHEVAHTFGLKHTDRGLMHRSLSLQDLEDAVHGLAFSGTEARQLKRAVAMLNEAP